MAKPSNRPERARIASGPAFAAAALVAGTLVLSSGAAIAAEGWPQSVEATYRIAFNGFDIGRFSFRTSVTGGSYVVAGDARISALLGAFRWRGLSRSSGSVAGGGPRPSGYTFDFDGTGKSGAIKLGFSRGDIKSISVLPTAPAPADTVPLRAAHLKDVLDPLSAVLALSRASGGNPCQRRLPVFDGKQRFDLVFSYLRQERVAEARPSGQPGVAIVCRVRYVPIAGHRANRETQHMAASSGIEISLRPVPSADIFVPYRITIPTIAGSATLTSERVHISTRREQIALTH